MDNTPGQVIKLALYGDSLACPRQGLVKSDERYIALLDIYIRNKYKAFYLEIRDRAKGGATINQLYSEYMNDNSYFELPADYIIIHGGVVDCAPRPVDDVLRDKISRLPVFIRRIIIKYLHKNRAKILEKNGGHVKTPIDQYQTILSKFVAHAAAHYKKVFVINICPTNAEMEKHSPGFMANIRRYNSAIKEAVSCITARNVVLVDLYSEIISANIDEYIVKEDGHHIYPKTHQLIATKIFEQI